MLPSNPNVGSNTGACLPAFGVQPLPPLCVSVGKLWFQDAVLHSSGCGLQRTGSLLDVLNAQLVARIARLVMLVVDTELHGGSPKAALYGRYYLTVGQIS